MKSRRSSVRYPCTGHVEAAGFPAFLERHLGSSRANLQRFATELGTLFGPQRLTLVNSGSSANLAAALALASACGKRRHAVTSGFTFPTTASALLQAGFSVTAVDTEPGGFCVDPAAVKGAIRPDTGLVCVTHFLGFPARIDELAALARERSLLVLQDACETMDLRVDGTPAHERGTLTTWSFYHPHHLPAFGGGAVASPDDSWWRLVESLVHWGRSCTCHVPGLPCPVPPGPEHAFTYERPGLNLEMSELNACFGRFQLTTWREQEARRRKHHATLFERLRKVPGLTVYPAPERSGSPFVFPVTLEAGDARAAGGRLLARGVEVRSLMGGPLVDQPAFAALPNDGLSRCRDLASRSFFVGVHQTLQDEDVADVAEILARELRA